MMANTESMAEAIQEAELGVDNEYNLKMKEQDLKRQQLIKYKETRRQEMAEQRLKDAMLQRQRLEEMLKSDELRNRRKNQLNQRPDADFRRNDGIRSDDSRVAPLARVDANVRFNRNDNKKAMNSSSSSRQTKRQELDTEAMDENTDYSKRQRFCDTNTVIIENLAPISNEYTLSGICQTVGPIHSCSVDLSKGVRTGRACFVDPSHAMKFCEKFNDYELDCSQIRTRLIDWIVLDLLFICQMFLSLFP